MVTNGNGHHLHQPEEANMNEAWDSKSDIDLCQDARVKSYILQRLTDAGKANGLKGFEQAKVIHLTDEQFTAENGILTASQKLARFQARKYFAKCINDMYTGGSRDLQL